MPAIIWELPFNEPDIVRRPYISEREIAANRPTRLHANDSNASTTFNGARSRRYRAISGRVAAVYLLCTCSVVADLEET